MSLLHPGSAVVSFTFATLTLLAGIAPAQNRAHPGAVPLGDGRWGSPEQAVEAGLVEYHGRFLPKKLQRKLRTWEKQDQNSVAWDDAYRTNSKHYRITTNVPRFIVELEIKPFLDALYRTYVDVFRDDFGLKGRAANKKFIKIYHGFADYGAHEKRTRGTPGFIRNGNELVVFYEETDPARFYGTCFHEGAHQFFKAMLPGAELPRWLDEALATYFEGCTYSRVTGEVTVAHFPPDRLRFAQGQLRRAAVADPDKLFREVPTEVFGASHYALAWSWVYTVTHVDDGNLRKGFGKLLRGLNGSGSKPIAEVFDKHVGVPMSRIDDGWREFVLGLEPGTAPKWVILDVASGGGSDGPDLKDGDLVWSVGGTEIYSVAQFRAAWKAADGPVEVVVVRSTPGADPMRAATSFVRQVVDPKSVRLDARRSRTRAHNLID